MRRRVSACITEGDELPTSPAIPWHRRNLTVCIACSYPYCQSCAWGCPFCGLGKGLDRRAEERQHVAIAVDILPEEEAP